MSKLQIAITNDDGIQSPGIQVLAKEFQKMGNAEVIAPASEQSTCGHSLTLTSPLRVTEVAKKQYSVDGKPADCIYLALHGAIKKSPQLVVSGINVGANLAQDVYYSGTVAGAREAAVHKVPAVASSLVIDYKKKSQERYYADAAKITADIVKKYLFALDKNMQKALKKWPKHMVLNINVPNFPKEKIKGIAAATLGMRNYSKSVWRRKDQRGRNYYWIGGIYQGFDKMPNSDCVLMEKKLVSVTPLLLDCTDHNELPMLEHIFS